MNTHIFKALLRPLCVGGVALTVLSACTMHQPSFGPTLLRNKITVAETIERMELYVGENGLNLSMRDQDAMGQFLAQYAQTGQGPLYLNVPNNAYGKAGVEKAQNMISGYLSRMGIGQPALQTGQYQTASQAAAPVIVSYRRLATMPIDCQQGASLTHTANNQPYSGFGCAQTANLAALIDSPQQLLAPYAMGNAYANKPVLVLGKFENSGVTATPRPTGQDVSAGGN